MATYAGELNTLQLEMQTYRVLDPACGSGNFLYVAYQELKRLEALLLSRIAERRRSDTGQLAMGFVTPTQFFWHGHKPVCGAACPRDDDDRPQDRDRQTWAK